MKIEIKHRRNLSVLFSVEAESMRDAVMNAVKSGADLRGANLSEADLREAYLRGANLSEADLREAYLRGANLSEADLSEADLNEADLSEADLRGAYLREADLSGAYIVIGAFKAVFTKVGES